MTDKMIPIRGYFKVERIIDGKVVDTYEDKNTVMARIPQLFAGMASGYYTENLDKYMIGCIAVGTGGTRLDTLDNEVPKLVRDNRTMLFSEFDFWNTPTQISEGQPPVSDKNKLVYQTSFNVPTRGDNGENTATPAPIEVQNEGATYPHTDWTPDNYRGTPAVLPEDGVIGTMSLQQNVIQYNIVMGQYAGNNDNDSARGYTEAGLYLKLNEDIYSTGNPLGTLFSMKTFPPQWKTSECSLRIEWKLFF